MAQQQLTTDDGRWDYSRQPVAHRHIHWSDPPYVYGLGILTPVVVHVDSRWWSYVVVPASEPASESSK
jgi:hypothetical protein